MIYLTQFATNIHFIILFINKFLPPFLQSCLILDRINNCADSRLKTLESDVVEDSSLQISECDVSSPAGSVLREFYQQLVINL